MAYKGDDLDLRTPQTWGAQTGGAQTGDPPQAPESASTKRPLSTDGPIWIDDALLACCNYAYDIALAHRSGDVRLEHLLHALTRIDASVDALEARGVRVAALRRESATIIAAEIPAGLTNGRTTPRRADEFAEALRLASAHGVRRGHAAGIEDLLFVLLDQRPDLTGLGLLTRHGTRAVPRDGGEPRYVDARYAPPDRYYRYDAPRYRADPAVAPVDAMQNSRIEALEQLVRSLSSDLASERQTLSALLKDLSRTANAQRDDQDRLQVDLFDRLQSIEQVVTHSRGGGEGTDDRLVGLTSTLERRVADMAQSWSGIAQRLEGVEAALLQSGAGANSGVIERLLRDIDLRPLMHRLDVIEEAVLASDSGGGDVAERLRAIEGSIADVMSFKTDGAASGGSRLLDGLENQTNAFAEMTRAFGERLEAVERAVASEIETSAIKHQAYVGDLKEVHEALMKLNQNQHTLAGSIDQWRGEAATDVASISTKLANLDRDADRPIEEMNAISAHMATMNRLFVERYHRRNRFWYWLFGTDDWLGASWPLQTAAIEADAARLKAPKAT